MTLGEKIAFAREIKGLTIRQLEKRCGISNAVISQIETGKVKNPGFTTVCAICFALGLPVERLAQGELEDALKKTLRGPSHD